MKLGWKFELLNKLSGEKSGALKLPEEQKYDIFAGLTLSENKKNSSVDVYKRQVLIINTRAIV